MNRIEENVYTFLQSEIDFYFYPLFVLQFLHFFSLHNSIVFQRAMQHVLLKRFRINSNLFVTSLLWLLAILECYTLDNSYHNIHHPIIIIERLRKYFTFQFRNANTEFDTVSNHFM